MSIILLLICPAYENLRNKFIPNKFLQIYINFDTQKANDE